MGWSRNRRGNLEGDIDNRNGEAKEGEKGKHVDRAWRETNGFEAAVQERGIQDCRSTGRVRQPVKGWPRSRAEPQQGSPLLGPPGLWLTGCVSCLSVPVWSATLLMATIGNSHLRLVIAPSAESPPRLEVRKCGSACAWPWFPGQSCTCYMVPYHCQRHGTGDRGIETKTVEAG